MIIGVSLVALALPIASVILTLQVLTRGGAPLPPAQQEAPEATSSGVLENVLEGIADEKLAPGELGNDEAKIELEVLDVGEERRRIEGLLQSYGGVAIPTSESASEVRLLVRVPEDRISEFLAECIGEGARPPAKDLMEIVIRKRKLP